MSCRVRLSTITVLTDAAAAEAAVGGDEHGGLRVVDAVAHRLGGEAAEDHAVRGSDSGAGEHGDGQLRHHRHVDGDPVALLGPAPLERGREAVDLAVEIPVGEHPRVARLAFPDDGGLGLARGGHVAIETVVGHVQLAAHEPLGVGRLPLHHRLPGLEPVELLGEALPEAGRILSRLLVHRRALDVGVLDELLRRRKPPLLFQESFDGAGALGLAGHWGTSFSGEDRRLGAPLPF